MPLDERPPESRIDFTPFAVTLVNLAARGVHLLFFLSLGNRFGADTLTDAVIFLQAPLLVLVAVTGGAADAVVMPAVHRALRNGCPRHLARGLISRALAVLLPLTAMALFVAREIHGNGGIRLLAVLMPVPCLAAVSAVRTGELNALGKYRAAVLGPLYGSLLSIPFVWLLPRIPESFALVLLLFEVGRAMGLSLHKRSYPAQGSSTKEAETRLLLKWALRGASLQSLASFCAALNPMVDVLFARILQTGAITHVEYANRLWNMVPLLLSGHLVIAYGRMSRRAAVGAVSPRAVHTQALKLGAAALAISLLAILLAPRIVELLYGFGNMDAANRARLGRLLACYLAGAGPFMASLVYVRALSAEGRIRIIAAVSGASVFINILMDLWLIQLFGLRGIGLATSMTYLINAVALRILYQRSAAWLGTTR